MRLGKHLGFSVVTFLIAISLMLGAFSGCDSDQPPYKAKEGGVKDGQKDQQPDNSVSDLPLPDQTQIDSWPASDFLPWPDQSPGYDGSGAPFGCQSDNDCFGQKCCSTPWGVKLCAPTCTFE
jgi:hypothetical protein